MLRKKTTRMKSIQYLTGFILFVSLFYRACFSKKIVYFSLLDRSFIWQQERCLFVNFGFLIFKIVFISVHSESMKKTIDP